MGTKRKTKKKKKKNNERAILPAEFTERKDRDETLYFIAGYTDWGIPYGITWEEYKADLVAKVRKAAMYGGEAMRELKLTKEQLQEIVDSYDMYFETFENFLNLETGEVVMVQEYGGEDKDEELLEDIDENPDRYAHIPHRESHDGYIDMVDFAETVEDQELRSELLDILSGGKRIFRRFKDALYADREVQERYYRFVEERSRQRVLDWLESLESIGVKVTIES